MRDINLIVVHCTASKEGVDIGVKEVDRIHKRRGWSGIGYHFLVRLDGTIEWGRPVEKIGAHVRGFNSNSIGITYTGGLDKNGKPKDTRTKEQKESLELLLKTLKKMHPEARICGHRDLSPDLNGDGEITRNEWTKACPCFPADEEYKHL